MDLIDRIRELGTRIAERIEHIKTEEATKIAFVQPFIRALGYDVNDPTEVVPEMTADVADKKGEKVDYAIYKDGAPIMLIECKWSGVDLDKVDSSQLERYFMVVTEARLGVLTNGVVYRFYSDLDRTNMMDKKPFLELDLLDINESLVNELKKFTKTTFDIDHILSTASELKYTREIKRILGEQLGDPSEDFVRFFVSQVYDGRMTQGVREQFSQITKWAFHQFISDRISDRLKSALAEGTGTPSKEDRVAEESFSEVDEDGAGEPGVVTTEEEIEGYYAVKSILRDVVYVNRIAMRDRKYYCGILLDDNARKPICRLHFNRPQKYLGLFDEQKSEDRVPIDNIDAIYKYADRLRATPSLYDDARSRSAAE